MIRRSIFSILVFTLFGLGCGGGSDSTSLSNNACGDLGLGTKIINGAECSSLTSSPVVRLVMLDSSGEESYCSGTMITADDIVTAAHCFLFNPVRTFAFIGDSIAASEVVEANSWTVHPAFGGSGAILFNDVAVVHLSRQVSLPSVPFLVSSSVGAGDVVSIFGYGTDENGSFDFEDLESGEMRVTEVSTNHIRADFDGLGSNTCQGDSGGPLFARTAGGVRIQGLTSTGTVEGCGSGDNSYFTNIQDPDVLSFLQLVVPDAAYL